MEVANHILCAALPCEDDFSRDNAAVSSCKALSFSFRVPHIVPLHAQGYFGPEYGLVELLE